MKKILGIVLLVGIILFTSCDDPVAVTRNMAQVKGRILKKRVTSRLGCKVYVFDGGSSYWVSTPKTLYDKLNEGDEIDFLILYINTYYYEKNE